MSCANSRREGIPLKSHLLPVDRSASDADIKRAYKKLSRKYHPDKNKEPDAEAKFVEVAHGELG